MLKRLRRQFIANNMILIGLVIVAGFSALMFISYSYEKTQANSAMERALTRSSNITFKLDEGGQIIGALTGPSGDVDDRSSQYNSLIITVETDRNGNIIHSATNTDVEITDDVLMAITNAALTCTDDIGTIPSYTLRFMKISTDHGYKIAFADRSSEITTLAFMFRLYFFAGILILGVMFLISDYMAHKAIAPVEKSWNNQNRFVADASHELKTPLTVILANTDIILANPDSSVKDQKKWLDNTKAEAKRMTQLVNDMLFLAKSDAAIEQSYNFMQMNISNMVDDCVLTFEALAFENKIELTSNIQPDIYVTADEAKLKQVVMILLDNAQKYVNENGKIYVELFSLQNNVKLSIRNTGDPIPKEKQSHIFERFYRADESRARDKGGYGLGLSIANNIMGMHKGKLALEYSDERGTCFSITIPNKQPTALKKK